jgi:transposase-like protein
MSEEVIVKEKTSPAKADQWRERLAEQERSGLTVRRFCKERGVSEYCFYAWRRRFREEGGLVRFALVDRRQERSESAPESGLELVLTSGERLRIGAGVDGTMLRTVLKALRG